MLRGFASFAIFACLSASFGFAQSIESSLGPSRVSPKEDWSRLPVDRKVLRPTLRGANLGTSEAPTYTTELIRLQWRPADPIDIWVVKPRGVEKPRVAL